MEKHHSDNGKKPQPVNLRYEGGGISDPTISPHPIKHLLSTLCFPYIFEIIDPC